MVSMIGNYKLEFEVDECSYDEAIEYFEKRKAESKKIKRSTSEIKVFKDGDMWIVSQNVEFNFRMRLFVLKAKIINFLGVS